MTIGPDDLVRKLLATGVEIQKAQQPAIRNVGALARARMLRAGQAAAGPDLKFSNLGKAKAVLGVKLTVNSDGAEAFAEITAVGPWGISDSDYKGYVITSRMAAISRKGIKRADYQRLRRQRDLDIAFGARGTFSGLRPMGNRGGGFGPRYKVQHPGNKNRGNWQAGREDVYGDVTKELQRRGIRAVQEVWTR